MLRTLGVTQCVISPRHPRSNGLVERYNRVVKSTIRSYLLMHPDTIWEDWLGEIAFGIRTGFSRTHGFSPYFLFFKQDPILPTHMMHLAEPSTWEVSEDTELE